MPIPVINPTTSILGYRQHQSWEYQPIATGLSSGTIGWSAVGLPAGMTIDAGTGLVSGAAENAGVYNAGIKVSDSINGDAVPLVVTIGIEPSTGSLRSGADLLIDLESGEVTLAGAEPTTSSAAEGPQPLFSAKLGDDQLLYVRFRRGEAIVDLGAIAKMTLGVKELDTESTLVIGGGADTSADGTPFTSAANATYIVHASFAGDALKAALENYESDDGTQFVALCELEWIEANPTSGNRVGPTTLRRTSQTFRVRIVRDLVEG